MLNKRVKEGIRKIRKPAPKIRFCLGTVALVSLCLMLLITATFSQIKISFNIPDSSLASHLKFEYIPQIPVVLFTAALLGEFWGLLTILIYIIGGLTPYYPVFALGGGFSYIFQYNFGYIFGFIIAVLLAGKQLRKGNSIKALVIATAAGILSVHLCGIIYLTLISLLRHDSFEFIGNMIYYQSVSKILYDIVFGFIAVLAAKISKRILWLILG